MTYQELKRLKRERRERAFAKAQALLSIEQDVVKAYESGDYLTKQIAEKFDITTRQVQRICKKWGVLRTQRQGAAVAGPLMPRHRLPGKSREHQIGDGIFRDIVIQCLKMQGRKFTHCEWCGKEFLYGKWQLHHTKYEGCTIDDLMIICQQCNLIPANRFLE
jgi:hypothetical protein